jgi:hypothetical protein
LFEATALWLTTEHRCRETSLGEKLAGQGSHLFLPPYEKGKTFIRTKREFELYVPVHMLENSRTDASMRVSHIESLVLATL